MQFSKVIFISSIVVFGAGTAQAAKKSTTVNRKVAASGSPLALKMDQMMADQSTIKTKLALPEAHDERLAAASDWKKAAAECRDLIPDGIKEDAEAVSSYQSMFDELATAIDALTVTLTPNPLTDDNVVAVKAALKKIAEIQMRGHVAFKH